MEPASACEWQVTTPAATMEGRRGIEDFDAVVRDYWPRVFRFALASLRERGAAESLAPDCFLRAWQARGQFRGDAGIQTWLMQIAVNLVRDRARNRRLRFWKRTQSAGLDAGRVGESVPDERSSPESAAAAKQRVAAVWSAMGDLPEKQRTVFLLRFVEDMDLLEIAAATGLKEGTVKTHLFRALQTVRGRIGGMR